MQHKLWAPNLLQKEIRSTFHIFSQYWFYKWKNLMRASPVFTKGMISTMAINMKQDLHALCRSAQKGRKSIKKTFYLDIFGCAPSRELNASFPLLQRLRADWEFPRKWQIRHTHINAHAEFSENKSHRVFRDKACPFAKNSQQPRELYAMY